MRLCHYSSHLISRTLHKGTGGRSCSVPLPNSRVPPAYVPTFISCRINKRNVPGKSYAITHSFTTLRARHFNSIIIKTTPRAVRGPPSKIQLSKLERQMETERTWSLFHPRHPYFVRGFWSGPSRVGIAGGTLRLRGCQTGTRRRCPRRATRSPARIQCRKLAKRSLSAR